MRDQSSPPESNSSANLRDIDSLVAQLRPVRLYSPFREWLKWFAFSVVMAFAGMVYLGLRNPADVNSAWSIFAMFALLAVAATIAIRVFESVVPGHSPGHWIHPALLGSLAILVGAYSVGWFEIQTSDHGRIGFTNGMACSFTVVGMSLIPLALLARSLKRGLIEDRRKTAVSGVIASGMIGAAMIELHCPVDETIHGLLWHLAPIALFGAGTAALFRHPDATGGADPTTHE